MGYDDRPDTSGYPVYDLACGHTQPVPPAVADTRTTAWCATCVQYVDLGAVAGRGDA